jgi:hypothetical protein
MAGALAIWLGACAVVALFCIGCGAVVVALAAKRVRAHAKAIEPVELIARVAVAQADGLRIQRALPEIQREIARARAALDGVAAALRTLKLAFTFGR